MIYDVAPDYQREHLLSSSTKDTYLCEVCGRGFGNKEELRTHLMEHDPDKVNERMDRAA